MKGRALFFVSLTAVSFVLASVACDEEQTSKFEETTTDAGPGVDGSPPAFADANTGNDGSGPVTCDPSLPDGFSPVWKAPAKKSACSTAQLGEYFDACLAPPSPDGGNPCKDWTDANAACAECIEPTDNSGPIQWHRDRYYYTLNVAGCLALERDEPEEGKCPAAYNATIACQRAACDGCFSAPNATFADFQNCQKASKSAVCSKFEGDVGTICGTDYNDPDGGAYDCFRRNDDPDQKTHFVRVQGIFCGP